MRTAASVRARQRGVSGEETARAYLAARGYIVRARNFRSRTGEIDVVAEKDGTIAFVEVKTWSAYGVSELEYSINKRKQGRIVDAARLYMAMNPDTLKKKARFDVVFVGQGDSDGGVRHIEDAFSGDVR